MIDHIGVSVSDFDRSVAFYTKALAPLGYTLIMTWGKAAGFGINGKPDFWIEAGHAPKDKFHVAFRASGRALVRDFYATAMAAGGKDNGGPGIREQYHKDYYGAFVLDPDGHNIEACCHEAFLD